MSKRIWKYENVVGSITHTPRLYGRVVHVAPAAFADVVAFWIEFEDEPDIGPERQFTAVGTGQTIPGNYAYCGTAVCAGGALVWHLYEILG